MNKNKWFLNGGRGSGKTFRLLCEAYENKIAELEQENKVLAQNLEDTEIVNKALEKENAELEHQLTHRNCLDCSNHSSKLRMRTLKLEKENAELKEELKKWKDGIALKDEEIGCIETDFNTFKSEAKEIIKALLNVFVYDLADDEMDVGHIGTKIKAEQFLNEVEK